MKKKRRVPTAIALVALCSVVNITRRFINPLAIVRFAATQVFSAGSGPLIHDGADEQGLHFSPPIADGGTDPATPPMLDNWLGPNLVWSPAHFLSKVTSKSLQESSSKQMMLFARRIAWLET